MADEFSRRGFLGLAASAAAVVSTPAWARHAHHRLHAQPLVQERGVSMFNVHTNESTSLVYWKHGKYLPHALHHINHFMRDHYNNQVHHIDPRLLDLIHDLHTKLRTSEPFHLVCGYRSPETNAWLHRTTGGVAVNSLHIKGQAADVLLPGVSLERLHNTALHMARGGVGYYPRSDFVHVDTGRVRQWEFG